MKDKIKRIPALGWGGIILVGVSLSILVFPGRQSLLDIGLVNPWKIANSIATILAIDIFSEGVPGDAIHTKARITALLSILFFYILGPGLMILFGLREEPEAGDNNKLSVTMIGFLAGLIITISSLVTFTIENISMSSVQEHSQISAGKSAMTDEIRQNLATLASESYEYWVLPEEHGGGGRSFSGLAIEELPAYQDLSGTYTFAGTPSDTLLRITGSGQPGHTAGDDTSRVLLTVQVQPPDEIIRWEGSR